MLYYYFRYLFITLKKNKKNDQLLENSIIRTIKHNYDYV